MPIIATDIHIRLSTTAGTAGNQTAQADPNASLGKYISTTDLVDATLDNLFSDITGDQNAAGQVDYRCIFIYNAHATLTLIGPMAWFSADVAGGATVQMARDNIGVVPVGQAGAQAAQIANSTTAPVGVGAFGAPATKLTGIALGDIPPGNCAAIWIKRTATNSAALNNDGCTISVSGDTQA